MPRVGAVYAAAMLLSSAVCAAAAQSPGELLGRVTDAETGAPVQAASVELLELDRRALSDAAGAYRLRGLEPGHYTMRVLRLGYAEATRPVEIENGRARRMDLALAPVPVPIAGLAVVGAREQGSVRIVRAAVEGSGARTAADLVARLPGVVVRRTSEGGPETVSIRGSGTDAVLVLLDGVALNDPVTGEADLSALAADEIEAVTLLPGAQSARYGPRAEAGVILVETRRGAAQPELVVAGGSLGAWAASAAWGAGGRVGWGAGVRAQGLGGGFDFELPPEVGGGRGRRRNADLGEHGVFGSAFADVAGGELRVRGGFEAMRRGLPGKGFAPSPRARQELERARASAVWDRLGPGAATHLSLAGIRRTVRVRDPAPPFGLPYDDSVAVESIDLEAHLEGGRRGMVRGLGTGLDLAWHRIRASNLSSSAPRDRRVAGLFAHGAAGGRLGETDLSLAALLRADFDDLRHEWVLNRALTASVHAGPVNVHVANRSGYSPPSLGDQFFQEAVGVTPNPELRAERVPSEIELGVRAEARTGPVRTAVRAAAYRGDVRDMIIWAPDFRFVWRPENFDVKRRGFEGDVALQLPAADLHVSLGHSYARVTYDRAGGAQGAEAVQVLYRPRNVTVLRAEWAPGAWRLEAEARGTGARNTVPAAVNRLPPFWTVAAAARHEWDLGDYALDTALRVDRLFDERATLIFGFPDPGRVFRVEVRVRRQP
ncbi:MAG: TonB-dependent receptor [Gemmatimonadetes bacterium]|nr:TonB-dependent receptor [Gemmatimonadota bacterium]